MTLHSQLIKKYSKRSFRIGIIREVFEYLINFLECSNNYFGNEENLTKTFPEQSPIIASVMQKKKWFTETAFLIANLIFVTFLSSPGDPKRYSGSKVFAFLQTIVCMIDSILDNPVSPRDDLSDQTDSIRLMLLTDFYWQISKIHGFEHHIFLSENLDEATKIAFAQPLLMDSLRNYKKDRVLPHYFISMYISNFLTKEEFKLLEEALNHDRVQP